MSKFSHIDDAGKATMVDVGNKPDVSRNAVASGFIRLQAETLSLIHQNLIKKGDVLSISEIAGVMAAKQTSNLIPLCHNININSVVVRAKLADNGIEVIATASCIGKTGIEMEALTAVSVSLLTIYDMCKAVDKQMVIENIKLNEKSKSEPK